MYRQLSVSAQPSLETDVLEAPTGAPGPLRTLAGSLLLALLALCVLLALPRLPKGDLAVDAEAFLPERSNNAPLMLAYFGFPGCVDTCPAALAELSILRARLESMDLHGRVEFAFVNIDPWADRGALDAWMRGFDPAITAYLPDEDGLALLERRLGLVLRPVAGRGHSHADYFVLLRHSPDRSWTVIDRSRRPDGARLERLAREAAGRGSGTGSTNTLHSPRN
ncbi:MAG: SCO family protein [Gammaproteobacteria bacterium]|nr:SCO family protein [Gammaproteobacteria bacterium]MCC5869892.1 SCO family protein [Gammaproteobacteria bacterium]